jgi:phosphohistidine phosphatase SixA
VVKQEVVKTKRRNIHGLFQVKMLEKAHRYCVYTFFILLFYTVNATAQTTELTGTALMERIQQGGVVLLMRHAQTVPGVGDPPNFKLSDCTTQRNLSEEGKAQSMRVGSALRTAGITPSAVRTSAWCRCKDTAKLAFGEFAVWSQLNSFFEDRSNEPQQTVALVRALQQLKPKQIEVWITHQVNITALTGGTPSMGEIFAVQFNGQRAQIVGRLTL